MKIRSSVSDLLMYMYLYIGLKAMEIHWQRREHAKGGHKDAGGEMVGHLQ
jgi:hypothetical protein